MRKRDRYFNDAERAACVAIIRKHGGQVNALCWQECKQALGRAVSDRSLRGWYMEAITPIKKARNRVPDTEATETILSLPSSAETTVVDGPSLPKEDLSGLTRIEKLDRAIDPRVERLVERIQDMSDASLVKQVADLMEARRRELGIPTAVMDALSQLGRLQALILRAIDRGDLPPGETLRSYLASHCDRLEAGGIERPVIELEIPMIIQPMAAAVPVGNAFESDGDATTV